MRNYDNEIYANGRLAGTFVRHKDGTPIEILGIGGKVVAAKNMISGKAMEFPYDELDITPVPLGYLNAQGRAVYIARTPMRQDWKQGARWKNLRWLEYLKPGELPPIRDNFGNRALGEVIRGIYPSYENTLRALTDGRERIVSKAWDRYFAMDVEWNIYHRGKYLIGKMLNPLRKEYKLHDEYWWTKEALEESLS